MRRDDDWGFPRSANLVTRDGGKMMPQAVAVRVALGPRKPDRRQLSLLAANYYLANYVGDHVSHCIA